MRIPRGGDVIGVEGIMLQHVTHAPPVPHAPMGLFLRAFFLSLTLGLLLDRLLAA